MVQIPLRRAHRLRAIILASPTKKLRPQPTERTPTAWHTNDEYTNAEASEEASASSAVANVSENRVLPIPTSSPLVNPTPTFITVFVSCLEMCPSDPVMIPASPLGCRSWCGASIRKTVSFREAFCGHFYITTSGNFSNPALLCCVMEMGIDQKDMS